MASAAEALGGARLAVDGLVHDLGKVRPSVLLQQDLSFTNTGTSTLEIRDVHGSCSCVRPGVRTLDVAPGERGVLPLGFYTSDVSGPFAETLTLTTNDPEHPTVAIEFKGTVWRLVEALPAFVVLDVTPDSWTNQTATVRIVNHGEQLVTVGEPFTTNAAFAGRLSCLETGRVWELNLRATGPLRNANHYGRFTLKTSSTEVPQVEVTAFVPALSAVVATPRRLQLPAGPAARQRVETIWLRATTDAPLTLGKPAVNLPGVDVTVTGQEPGRLYRVQVMFPKGFELPKEAKAELAVPSNHPQYPTIRVPIVRQD